MNLPIDSFGIHEEHAGTYDALMKLREAFHRSGRLDDSNAKLDEVAKLFATYLAFRTGHLHDFPDPTSTTIVADLQSAFSKTVTLPHYRLSDNRTIFGSRPALDIRLGDEEIAGDMVRLVKSGIDPAFEPRANGGSLDLINEAFGHFVRDNFRSNVEDAQFMTPIEVTSFMADLALQDMVADEHLINEPGHQLTVLDPACGVGSCLGAFYKLARDSKTIDPHHIRIFGQDKVERMARLATLNLAFFDVHKHRISLGNSLEKGSPIDHLNGTVDLILTNPPYGAKFDQRYINNLCGDNLPIFNSLHRAQGSVASELLFVDRGVRLLRQGGRMLIIVPDGVISAKGLSAVLRDHLALTCTIRAVIELPATTFAQAGTRTKTAILYLQKRRAEAQSSIFMGIANQLGFEVTSRKGMQIKIPQGENELPTIKAAYSRSRTELANRKARVVSSDPSCVMVAESAVLDGNWTPKHYSSKRIEMIAELDGNSDFEMVPLSRMVEFCSGIRKPIPWRQGWAFVSVKHVLDEGFVNASRVFEYSPKTPGILTYPGEILLARINPRIPRVCVTPDFGAPTLCSSEFEIMSVHGGVDAYALAYMLQTEVVQQQMRSLTSGTSASHNRIRSSDLSKVVIPVAKLGTGKDSLVASVTNEYRKAMELVNENAAVLAKLRRREDAIFNDKR